MSRTHCQLQLTCVNQKEADKIGTLLLDKKLIACARTILVGSKFRWQGKIEEADEVLLIMESRIDLFDMIEAQISKLHSYDTFVLTAVPIEKISKKAAAWLHQEINSA